MLFLLAQALAAPFTLGSGPVQSGELDTWNAILVIDKATPWENTGVDPVQVRINGWRFYAGANRGRVTPFVVRLDNADPTSLSQTTLLAIGDTRYSGSDYTSAGPKSFPFGAVAPVLVLQPGERIAAGYLDADAAGNSFNSVIPFQYASGSVILLSGGPGDGESARLGAGVGGSPTAGTNTGSFDRDYAFTFDADDCVLEMHWADADLDGFGDSGAVGQWLCAAEAPAGEVPNNTDCDDSDAANHPGNTEACDGADNDCDGAADEGLPIASYYLDSDGDGYGDPTQLAGADCQAPSGTVWDDTDCNDLDPSVNPAAAEICDGQDNDCDGAIDEDVGVSTFYRDLDGDGFGDPDDAALGCAAPLGYVASASDCDDSDDTVHPGVSEICDGIDNDCSGAIDDGLALFTWYDDLDADGFGDALGPGTTDCAVPSGTSLSNDDCDDLDPATHPGAVEQCDGVDNDCNAQIDDSVATVDWYPDLDDDGFGAGAPVVDCQAPPGGTWSTADTDCDDADPTSYPGAPEVCDGIDNDCDGPIDAADPSTTAPLYFPDNDADGYGDDAVTGTPSCAPLSGYSDLGTDCDDGDSSISPAASEICPDGVDNDCDGLVDDADPDYAVDPVDYWFDQDGDGFGTPSLQGAYCPGTEPLQYVPASNGFDCDDSNALVSPSAAETCDGLDEDCNGLTDDGLATLDSFEDLDADGFGDDATLTSTCAVASGRVTLGGDCDDLDPNAHPGAVEVCDGIDNDCNAAADEGLTSLYFLDADQDGFGAGEGVMGCPDDPPFGLDTVMETEIDCDDGEITVFPGAPERCNGVDDDCDGTTDEDPLDGAEYFVDSDGDGVGTGDPVRACPEDAPEGSVELSGDCDDADSSLRLPPCEVEAAGRISGCTCDSGQPAGVMALLLPLFGLRRRRRP